MEDLSAFIDIMVSNPSDSNKQKYEQLMRELEYKTLKESEEYPKKSRSYFAKRNEAFALRGMYATTVIKKWVSKYGSTDGCPCSYADTLNVPFRKIEHI